VQPCPLTSQIIVLFSLCFPRRISPPSLFDPSPSSGHPYCRQRLSFDSPSIPSLHWTNFRLTHRGSLFVMQDRLFLIFGPFLDAPGAFSPPEFQPFAIPSTASSRVRWCCFFRSRPLNALTGIKGFKVTLLFFLNVSPSLSWDTAPNPVRCPWGVALCPLLLLFHFSLPFTVRAPLQVGPYGWEGIEIQLDQSKLSHASSKLLFFLCALLRASLMLTPCHFALCARVLPERLNLMGEDGHYCSSRPALETSFFR